MWLADDDEISPNYVEVLAKILDENPDVVSAAGHWVYMADEFEGRPMRTLELPATIKVGPNHFLHLAV